MSRPIKMPSRRVDPPEPFGEPFDTDESWEACERLLKRLRIGPFAVDPRPFGETACLHNDEPASEKVAECRNEEAALEAE